MPDLLTDLARVREALDTVTRWTATGDYAFPCEVAEDGSLVDYDDYERLASFLRTHASGIEAMARDVAAPTDPVCGGAGPYDPYSEGMVIEPSGDRAADAFAMHDPIGALVVRVAFDGTVEFGEGFTADSAARQFWTQLGQHAHHLLEASEAIRRLSGNGIVREDASDGG